MLGRLHHVVLDCPDPAALAAFYSRLLGQPVTYQSDDWVVVAANDTSSGLAFQLAPDHRPPTWPDPAGPRVLALGARNLDGDVYADPAGHPFCLIPRPGWAPLIPDQDPSVGDQATDYGAGPHAAETLGDVVKADGLHDWAPPQDRNRCISYSSL